MPIVSFFAVSVCLMYPRDLFIASLDFVLTRHTLMPKHTNHGHGRIHRGIVQPQDHSRVIQATTITTSCGLHEPGEYGGSLMYLRYRMPAVRIILSFLSSPELMVELLR